MGKERWGKTRINIFVDDNLAIQIKESSYEARQSMTNYIIQAVAERISTNRKEPINDLQDTRSIGHDLNHIDGDDNL